MNDHVENTMRNIINLFYSTKGYAESGLERAAAFEKDGFEGDSSERKTSISEEKKSDNFKTKDREL